MEKHHAITVMGKSTIPTGPFSSSQTVKLPDCTMMFGFPLWDENYSHTPCFDSTFVWHILGYGHTAMTIRLYGGHVFRP